MSLARLLQKGGLQHSATATPATPATVRLLLPPTVATVATVSVATPQNPAANDPAPDPALLEAQRLTAALLRSAMRRCTDFGDSPAARQAMRRDVLDTPLHLQADLLAYFQDEGKPGLDRVIAKQQALAATQKASKRAMAPEPTAHPADWRDAAEAYHAHHFGCPQCQAAGRGAGYGPRCGTGAALWNIYQNS